MRNISMPKKAFLYAYSLVMVGASAAGLIVSTIVFASSAYAAPIKTWQVDVSAEFDQSTLVWEVDPYQDGDWISPTSLRWGWEGFDGLRSRSGLDIIDSPASAPVNTNGPAVANISVTHLNQPIVGTALDSVVILSTLTLTPLIPSGPGFSATLPFNVNFLETFNEPDTDTCADGGQNGVGVNINGCADIFVIDPSSLSFDFMYPDLDGTPFLRTYQISFFELTSGLNPLPAAACTAAGANSPCTGFETREETDTTFQFAARITTEIPEPTTLALIGLGFAGFAYKRRRLKRKGSKVA